ncbi:cytochrome c/FTR1 family iron permease [Variovorax sp. RA8]|uniref:cytochrome c/FTR1 family iron permease n=1 Tax=Variovorax sp. (strain JCM 16519 / RA8) TaxID=662548 RepID=UPI000AE7E122|nr:cytochrome c/FTR1 family iron permease [Variovorax sp. RA8]VTU42408.1 Ferrous iron uptake protein [Variovorax sp. RA8]
MTVLGSIRTRVLVLASLFTMACWSAWGAEAPATDKARQAWQLLDYVAVDYGGAVRNGKVESAAEYEEMKEFVATASQQLETLPNTAALPELRRQSSRLSELVAQKSDPKTVGDAAHALAAALVKAYPFPLSPAKAPDLTRGAALFQATCAACHGERGTGNGPLAARLDPHPTDFSDRERARNRSPLALYQIMSQGVQGTAMASFKDSLSDDDRWALAFFVGGLSYSDADRLAGAVPWKEDGRARESVKGLDAVAQLSEGALADKVDPKIAASLIAFLRAQPGEAAVSQQGIAATKERLAQSRTAFVQGDRERAGKLALSAYLDGFEPLEPALRARNAALLARVETAMGAYRSAIGTGDRAKVESAEQALQSLLDLAQSDLQPGDNDALTTFLAALTILLREGLEALLVVVAMIAFLRKAERPDVLHYVHAGWILALAGGGLTWFAATYLVSVSGASRELTEGFSSLFAAVVLLGVGMWMHRKSVAGRWQAYLKEKLSNALNQRTAAWFLFSLAFIAVYREVFETVLFFAALWTEGNGLPLLAGLAAGSASLGLIAWVLLRTSARLPIGQFFAASSLLVALLAVVLAGKGVAGLQEAGLLDVTPAAVPRVELLGIYPSWQTLSAQLVVLLIAVTGFVANLRPSKLVRRG